MAEIPKNMRFLLFGYSPRINLIEARLVLYVAIVSVVLGIISASTDNSLGLGSGNWFLLSMVLEIYALSKWLISYFAVKEGYNK